MTTAERHAFLAMHIPYKLGAIDLCQEMADLLARSGDQHMTTITFGSARTFKFKNVRPVTNAFVEHGFMSCRVLLEFLGVGLNNAQTGLAEYRNQRADTVTLRDFGRPLLAVADVEGQLANDRALIDGIVHVIRAGHKGGAHLTRGGDSLPIDRLAAGCRATRILVDHFLFRALNHAVPPTISYLRDE
jgi:hypothetical protein